MAELMRLLIDEHDLEWSQAWEITQQTLAIFFNAAHGSRRC